MSRIALVRYGTIAEVARFSVVDEDRFARGDAVVVRTHRGVQLGTFLEMVSSVSRNGSENGDADEPSPDTQILRRSGTDDESLHQRQQASCEREFAAWRERIARWDLKLELIDLERTLDDGKLILYVLNERGPESTRLALQAAAAGLGIVEVQPVSVEGLVPAQSGGCGSGGCGSGQCHS